MRYLGRGCGGDAERAHRRWAHDGRRGSISANFFQGSGHAVQGRAFFISRSVVGPVLLRLRAGGGKRKQENGGGPGAQPSESVPVEKKIQILTTKFHELGSKPKS
jgi:hypothetical protein